MNLPRLLRLSALWPCLALLPVSAAAPAEAPGTVYELRTYVAAPGKGEALLARFREHTTRLFERHGMVNVGYWLAADAKDGGAEKLIYLLRHRSREAAKASWQGFLADPDWRAVAKASEAGGKLVAGIESVFLAATDFTAPMDAGNGGGERVFELRTYVAAPGKLPALDARFRDHTRAIFARQGMTNLGYFHPVDEAQGAGTTLIYFLSYLSRDAAAAAWQGFREDPSWIKARTASEKDGKLTAKVTSVYLRPADFSRIR
ncbi:MAG: NIPSNAP family protein [Verrucomicrobia bacterium]|nr:NIPSNAP family protein [Verrucomicrobiota bacterium]